MPATAPTTTTPSPSCQSSPSVAFPSVECGLASLSLSSSSPRRSLPPASPSAMLMPRSGSMALKSPPATPHRQGRVSRTIAVLMRSAAKIHRLAIVSRIINAGFDILAERSEHWYTPEDDDFLSQFLAREPTSPASPDPLQKWIPRLTNGSIYVLVLERTDAAKAWLDLVGSESLARCGDAGYDDSDDGGSDQGLGGDGHIFQIGDDGLPIVKNGLRKTYGVDAFYGSPDEEAAEAQISFCFPELSRYAASAAAGEGDTLYGRAGSPSEAAYGRRTLRHSSGFGSGARPKLSGASARSSERCDSEASKEFRARPVPSTTHRASIQPRLSKAAALRMGVELSEAPVRRASEDGSLRSSSSHEGPLGISGLPKAEVPLPASLRPPTVTPRLNRAAAARTKSDGAATFTSSMAAKVRERKEVDYSNTPGHKRNSVISVASTAAPAIAPRQTRASMGRISAFFGSSGAASPGPGSVRRDELPSTPSSSSLSARRASSITSLGSGTETSQAGGPAAATGERPRKPVDYSTTPGHKRQSLSFHIPALAAPAMPPRVNRASLARTTSSGNVATSRPSSVLSSSTTLPSAAAAASSAAAGVKGAREKVRAQSTDPSELYANTPGHRRKSLTVHVPALAAPSIVPRSNAAADARIGRGAASTGSSAAAAPHQDTPPTHRLAATVTPPSAYKMYVK
ncbi:hypothetical protein ACQY0O_008418 [Thecaphora frezii]